MKNQPVKVTVYGAEQICASCVNAPGSWETYEWLQAAISRKYKDAEIDYQYIDVFQLLNRDENIDVVQRILDDDLFYPVVMVNEEIVDEGNPRLKKVYQALEKLGVN
ncbi:YuzD family protein [Aquibacillus saliphilus]|uniref:YuzD family protein n=1 Tax=Aquibacillus saliphilus TaxID=1909422 RepID=UPI001CEFF427|nr:YuzD family protein [Aquibacillus saliphilus]